MRSIRRSLGLAALPVGSLTFRCNICGAPNCVEADRLGREDDSCRCGSKVRYRGVIRVLSLALFGRSLAIPDFPVRRDLTGIGLTDWEGYARPLASKLGYTNTFLHREPKLDITAIDGFPEHGLDFVISSDVFEHVPPPVSRAFQNARKLLKPGGTFILTVPYRNEPGSRTIEHFPDLHEFEIVRADGKRQLKNTTRDGRAQIFDDLVFHGAEGEPLERRVFSAECLRDELATAGFKDFKIHDENEFVSGIYWAERWSLPMTART